MHRPHSCRCRPYRMRHRRSRWNCHRFFAAGEERQGQQGGQGQSQHTAQHVLFHFCFLQKFYMGILGGGWRDHAGGLDFKNKKGFCPTWDKSLCFCDTTQIDILRCPLALRTIMRTPRITEGSRRTLLGKISRSSRPRKAIHTAAHRSDLTTRSSLGMPCDCLPSAERKPSLLPHRFVV